MKNNAKIIITVTLIFTILLQIFIPSYLLIHHYTLIKNTLGTETEYRFQLDRIFIDYRNSGVVTASSVTGLTFEIYDFYTLDDAKLTVTVDENGIAAVEELADGVQTDTWFSYKYYAIKCYYTSDKITFSEGIDVENTIKEVHRENNWFNRNDPDRDFVYVTAKIYKGMFIPTAIYFRDQKIITINAY